MSQTCAGTAHHAPARGVLKNAVPFPAGGGGVAHFISKPLYRLIRPLADGRCAIFIFAMILSAMPGKAWGQTPCNYACAVSGYKCIIASSIFSTPTSISNFIGSGANDLTPMPGAATTQQGVVIKGWVAVDENYTFATGSDIVFADSESGLIVNNGAVLTFKESPQSPLPPTTLRGCNVLWGGIYVRANSTLIFENGCAINDAYSAVNLYHNSNVVSTGAKYSGNYICMAADRIVGDPATINATASLTGNDFDGNGFLAPYKGNDLGRPHHAIIANYVNQFSIGAVGGNVAKNVFKGFAPAASGLQIIPVVASFNTNLTVRNSTFEDIGDFSSTAFETPNIGIWASSDNSNVFTLDVKGAGEFGGPTFKNVYTGIECYSTCLKVDQCVFLNGIDHIKVLPTVAPVPPQVPPALSYSITNSTFGSFRQAAISARNVFPAQKFVVSNNTFFDDSSISTGSTAAEFVSNSPIVAQLSIKDNTVAKVSDIVSSGFVLTGISNAYVGNNTFINGSSASSVELILNSSKQGIIKENSFSGINDVTDGEYGLLVRNSYATKALCNTFDQLGAGMYWQGNGCDGSILVQNEFGSHNFGGIYLPDFTTIGQQPAYGNRWPVNSSTDEARFELDPLDPAYSQKLNASKFIINIPESVNQVLWPQPRYPAGNDWFSYLDIVQKNFCSSFGEVPNDDGTGLTTTDGMVLDNTHPNYGGFAATKWDAQLRLYGKLHTHPDLRPAASAAATFYSTQQNEPFARLAVALEQYDQAVAPGAALNQQLGDYYTQIGSLTQQIADADSMIASGVVVASSLSQMRSGYVHALDSVSQLATVELNTFAAARNAALSTLQTTVNDIGTTQTWETNLKSALSILLTGPQASPSWAWTNTQRSTLESIAAQCAHEGGYGVILSRLMLGDDASNDDNCFSQPRVGKGKSQPVAGDVLQVYPNPTTGLLHILHAGEGLLLVRDQTGRTVLEQQTNGTHAVVDLSPLSNGMYFLQVVSGSQSSPVHKICLNQ